MSATPLRKHHRFLNLLGQKFGRLEVIMLLPGTLNGSTPWMCRCDCGSFHYTTTGSLRSGNANSCGCIGREKTTARNYRHGQSKTPEYSTWNHMQMRCYNSNRPEFFNYGGRGIRVCDRWRYGEDGKSGFECFYADVGPRPSNLFSIERIDANGNYEPANVKWATRGEQALNKRRNRFLFHNGERILAAKLAEINGIGRGAFDNRVRVLGWDLERAAKTPVVRGANQSTYRSATREG